MLGKRNPSSDQRNATPERLHRLNAQGGTLTAERSSGRLRICHVCLGVPGEGGALWCPRQCTMPVHAACPPLYMSLRLETLSMCLRLETLCMCLRLETLCISA